MAVTVNEEPFRACSKVVELALVKTGAGTTVSVKFCVTTVEPVAVIVSG